MDPAPAASESILVVDDVEANRDALARRLRRRGYRVTEAAGGGEALALLDREAFHLVLLDVMMPGVDGLEVLRTVRRTRSPMELPVIMATAKSEGEDVVRALDLGANDYVTKPLDFPVVFARVRTQLDYGRAARRALELEARLRRDLAAAARVQASLLPRGPVAALGFAFAWAFRPCDELAGDALNAFRLDDDQAAAYVLDVSGHGVASALLAVTITRMLSPAVGQESLLLHTGEGVASGVVPPAHVADRLAHLFPFDPATEQYFTLVYGVLSARTREFRYVSAGHPEVVHLTADAPARLLPAAGFPVGLGDGSAYEELTVRLAPGDRLYLYSDGVTEAMDPAGDPFGTDRLLDAVNRGRAGTLAGSVDLIEGEVRRWLGDASPRDDISLLAVEARSPFPPAPEFQAVST